MCTLCYLDEDGENSFTTIPADTPYWADHTVAAVEPTVTHSPPGPSHTLVTVGLASDDPSEVEAIRQCLAAHSDCFREELLPQDFIKDIPPLEFPTLPERVCRAQYPLKERHMVFIDTCLEKYLRSNTAEVVTDPEEIQRTHISPIVVAETGGKQRLCLDPTRVNFLSKQFCQSVALQDPPPMLDLLHRAVADAGPTGRFLQADLCSGFNLLRLAPSLARLFGFRHRGRICRFTRLPFGWVLSPGVFVAAVAQLLGLDWYVDDQIRGFRTVQVLLDHLCSVLATCAAHGFKLKGSKCRLWLPQLAALGYRISM